MRYSRGSKFPEFSIIPGETHLAAWVDSPITRHIFAEWRHKRQVPADIGGVGSFENNNTDFAGLVYVIRPEKMNFQPFKAI